MLHTTLHLHYTDILGEFFLVRNSAGQESSRDISISEYTLLGYTPEVFREIHFGQNYTQESGTKIQPKEEVLGRISLRTSGQKLRSDPPNPGRKKNIFARTSRADVMKKLWSEKLRADFSFPKESPELHKNILGSVISYDIVAKIL